MIAMYDLEDNYLCEFKSYKDCAEYLNQEANKWIKKLDQENLTKLIEEHKKETHPYKKYEFDSTSYTLLLIDINNLIKENQELKLELSGYRQAILNNKKMLGLKEQLEEEK